MNIQNEMKELFGGSCYGYCLAWLFGESNDIKYLTSAVLMGWKKGYIDNDGYVSDPLSYVRLISGKKYRDVLKVAIDGKEMLPIGPAIVEMKCPSGGSHFVVCHRLIDGDVVLDFDPSEVSNSWKAQKFISYRQFIQ